MTTKSFNVLDNGDIVHIKTNQIIGRIGEPSVRAKFRTMIVKSGARMKFFWVFLGTLGKAASQATNGSWNRSNNNPS